VTAGPEVGTALLLEECPYCGELVPPGAFCGYCGAHFSDAGGRRRLHHYAAAPHEHVLHTSIISTLFPHLPRRHAHIFRETLIAGALLVVLLAAIRLYTPSLLLSAFLLPVLYLIYGYEVEVYESQPLLVLLCTIVVGAAFGFGFTIGFGHVVNATYNGTKQGPLFNGVLLPIVAQVLMLAGPCVLWARAKSYEVLDGLSFGVCSALGFTVASVVTEYWHTFTAPLLGSSSVSAQEIAGILRAGILVALVNAATTGTVTASIWLAARDRSRRWHTHVLLAPPAAAIVAFSWQVGLGLVSYYVTSLLLDVVLWAIAAAVLLVWVRICVHNALLEEGAEHHVGEAAPCPECHRLVPTMYFCPACGVARSASPKGARRPGTAGTLGTPATGPATGPASPASSAGALAGEQQPGGPSGAPAVPGTSDPAAPASAPDEGVTQ